jgi:superfamily II DNA/RNA helicase
MQALKNHRTIIDNYKRFLKSFFNIADSRIKDAVEEKFEEKSSEDSYLPEPLIQFNPSYKIGSSLVSIAGIHPELKNILGKFDLYDHQIEAIKQGISGKGFIVTSGTGSGKSLTFLATVFNDVLQSPGKGIRAVIVYPMNALINSQEEEIKKYEINYLKSFVPANFLSANTDKSLDEQLAELKEATTHRFPVTYAKYTGQESSSVKESVRESEPNIILTNYMMLELIMTRLEEKDLRKTLAGNLKFLAFDELHTYRGRQGADVGMLIRRIKNLCSNQIICIGTSATMSSEGNADDKKKAIAAVAYRMFNENYGPDQIIGERLETSTNYNGQAPSRLELTDAIMQPVNPAEEAEAFKINALAIWLETRIALVENEKKEFERSVPLTLRAVTNQLALDSGASELACETALFTLLEWIEQLNIKGAGAQPRKSYLPFKIHQFISQTGTVQVTLDKRSSRHITLNDERYIKIDGKETLLFPLLFSRYSGFDFLCVKLLNDKILPRDPENTEDLPPRITQDDIKADKVTGKQKRVLNIDDFPYGYIILQEDGEEPIWTDEHGESLPDSWFTDTVKHGRKIKNFYEHRLPQLIFFQYDGSFSWEPAEKYPLKGWYIPAYLLFDPTSGIIFDLKTSENTKLSRLGNEGRSSATTILGANILKALKDSGIPQKNQKFLSFTDNRQDASLQAGHFNDFFTIARLRSAIYQAVKKNPAGLDCNQIGIEVFKELDLSDEEYARYPSKNPHWPEEKNKNAFQKFVIIKILYDLKLGWRYTTPNLEQTALVKIDYYRLDEFCSNDRFFAEVEWLRVLSPESRAYVLTQILNYFRTSFAFDHIFLMEKREEIELELKTQLDEEKSWSLNFDEKIEAPYVLLPFSAGKERTREYTASIGTKSYIGKYIKRLMKENTGQKDVKQVELENQIVSLCKLLEGGNYLNAVEVKVAGAMIEGYRIRVDNIIWKPGNEKKVLQDEIRFIKYKNVESSPNSYFQEFYKQDFKTYERPGREHTGQLSNDDRISREDDFRKGNIAALFCSPTMELGIDISQLNIVHMRNVPPRPDNYAQRSGRAGRSGQSALVYTFCSRKAPHDRNYFKNPAKMVSGTVVPPKMDLTNEELIKSHFNAFILMELELNISLSVAEALDIEYPSLPVHKDVKIKMEDLHQRLSRKWVARFHSVVSNIEGISKTGWYDDNWLTTQANAFLTTFDHAFQRWRVLYSNTKKVLDEAHLIIQTPNHPRINEAKRTQAIALRQRDLLLNKNKASAGSESEFYIFRYLASEGFLPGYNFTRLPVRAFVGRNKAAQQGEFISRPRFIALKEFGPHNLIYHRGSKYKVIKMQLNQGGDLMQTIKTSKETGYAFIGKQADLANNDPITLKAFKGGDSFEKFANVIELNESEARIEERISSNEENRVSQGYNIDHYFSFSKGIEYTQRAMINAGDQNLLQVIYDQAASLIQINKKWKVTKDEEFPIGKVSGRWKTRTEEEQFTHTDDPIEKVRIYATSTADILYVQPIKELQLDEDGVCTLAFALKQAIENTYQVEESEIGVWIMGQQENKNILIYESVEGSLGILKDLLNNAAQLQKIFRESYRLIGFDPDTLTDIDPNRVKASYDDLLSYYNQQYHERLDRFSIKSALEKLMQCTVDNQQGGRSLKEQYEYLLVNYDLNSSTEKPLIEYLYQHNRKLPDKIQHNVPDLYVSADFVYKLSEHQFALIFCDGSVHDLEKVKQEDRVKREHCRLAGYEIIEWHYSEPIEAFVKRNQHIFRITR